MLAGMFYGTIWELLIPMVVAVGAVSVYLAVPRLRMNRVLRIALVVPVVVTAIEVMLAALFVAVLLLAGGQDIID